MGKYPSHLIPRFPVEVTVPNQSLTPCLQDTFSPEEQDRKRGVELNNGRAAMMGILALMVHEELNGDPYVINSLLGSPVAFNAGL